MIHANAQSVATRAMIHLRHPSLRMPISISHTMIPIAVCSGIRCMFSADPIQVFIVSAIVAMSRPETSKPRIRASGPLDSGRSQIKPSAPIIPKTTPASRSSQKRGTGGGVLPTAPQAVATAAFTRIGSQTSSA